MRNAENFFYSDTKNIRYLGHVSVVRKCLHLTFTVKETVDLFCFDISRIKSPPTLLILIKVSHYHKDAGIKFAPKTKL